ncbi:MAG: murein hydrolase activator EnvC family protein [Actinomycetes bacterium]
MRHVPRRRRAVATLAAAALALAVPAVAQQRSEQEIAEDLADAERDAASTSGALSEAEARIARVATELAELRDRLDAARGRLRQLEGQVALAEDEVGAAERRTEVAQENLAHAERLLELTEAELATQERRLVDRVAEAYKYGAAGQGAMLLRIVREAEDPNALADGLYKLGSVAGFQAGVVDEVTRLRAEREDLTREASRTRDLADQAREDATVAAELVRSLRDDAAAVTSAIATDEARQAQVLAELEEQADDARAVLAAVDARRAQLAVELEQERARRVAAGAGVCPVDGARVGRDFSNDWGFPRPGSRSHEGTDVFANRGTPVRAMYAGVVKAVRVTDTGLGGRYVSYTVGPGEYWYNAHLDEVAPGMVVGARVQPGTLIGTVGNSGNARTTPPHLHIGHYLDDGRRAVNPYPVLADACP